MSRHQTTQLLTDSFANHDPLMFIKIAIQSCLSSGAIAMVGMAYPAVAQTQVSDAICQRHDGTSPHSIQALNQAITAIVERPEQRQAHWGIMVQDINTDAILYQNNAQKFFIPASNAKLFTTAAALVDLGENYRFKTAIYTVGNAPHLDKLILVGTGDPTLASEDLEDIINHLKQRQVVTIEDVILIDNYFTDLSINPTWEWSDLPSYYASPVNSFILDENAFTIELLPTTIGQETTLVTNNSIALNQWHINNQLMTAPEGEEYQGELSPIYGETGLTISGNIAINAPPDVWDLAIPHPAKYALDTMLFKLENVAITTQRSQIITKPIDDLGITFEGISLLTEITSPSLIDIIKTTNQDSHNLFAESLFRTLSKRHSTTGSRAIADILSALEIDASDIQLADGSGLSRHNLVTPMAIVQTLDIMADHPAGDSYQDSLAIAGTTGTLRRRFQDQPITGHFFGKTGTMSHIAALSGYLQLPGDRTLALSILVNQSPEATSTIRQSIDDIVTTTYQWGQCTRPNNQTIQTEP